MHKESERQEKEKEEKKNSLQIVQSQELGLVGYRRNLKPLRISGLWNLSNKMTPFPCRWRQLECGSILVYRGLSI